MSQAVHVQHTAGRVVRAALAFLMLTSSGCQGQIQLPAHTALPEAASAIAPTPDSSVTLALLGDVMLGRDAHPNPDTFAFLAPFLTSADLALANLESPLTDSPAKTESSYVLCAPPGNVRYLADSGFDLLAIANNHNLDCGPEGLLETQKTLTKAGLGFIGPSLEPIYRSVNGIQLAFLGFDAISGFDIETAVQQVRTARQAGDLVVVSIHWGLEYQSGPSASQKQMAQDLADAGATLIWGHHPHVLQPAEWVNDGKTLVLHSLGNALFDQYGLEATRQSALVLVTLDSNGPKLTRVIPFLIDSRDGHVREAGEAEVQRIMKYFNWSVVEGR